MVSTNSPVTIIDDFLSIGIIDKLNKHVLDNHDKYAWRPNRIWDPSLVSGSPSIMLMDASPLSAELLSFCATAIPGYDFSSLSLPYPVFYDAPVNSYVNWHSEEVPLSISIYLNSLWKREWGGLFLYEDNNSIHGIVPRFNRAVISGPRVAHSVTTINPTTESNRYSLQLFFIEKDKNEQNT
jgi:hypothetical protein